MTLADFIVIGIIALVVGAAVAYIVKAKKSGKKCIGCPDGCSCSSKKGDGSCGAACSCCIQAQSEVDKDQEQEK